MNKTLIKSLIVVALFFGGSYLIQNYLFWDDVYARYFLRFFISNIILYIIVGLVIGCNSFKIKKWNARQNIGSLIFIAVVLLGVLYICGYWLFPGNVQLFKIFVGRSYEMVERGLLIVLPILIGINISKIIFE